MSRTSGNLDMVHPRLSVGWITPEARAHLTDAFRGHALVVDRPFLDREARSAAERREHDEREGIAQLESELRALEVRCSSAEMALADLIGEQNRLRGAADWCDRQPADDLASAERIETLSADVVEHSRVSREVTRRLERVLEQRAAAEAALEEARRELTGLGATGIDETDVRRQMESASHDLRAASTEYKQAMTEVARRQAILTELEQALARGADAPERDETPHGDQLQAMSRALSAKFAPREPQAADVTEGDLQRARAEVRAAQERADDAAVRLSTARQRISGFEIELTARIDDGDARSARHEAALALEAQVASVERQLAEAEAAARAEVDDATRAMSRTEVALERERQETRDRRRQLGEFVALVPADDRPPVGDDLVSHARTIASALRDLVAPMQRDVDHARTTTEVLRSEHDAKTIDLERRHGRLGVVDDGDRRSAIQVLLDDRPGLVVLDDVVGTGGDGRLATVDLARVTATDPIIVLTSDPDVAGWAIDLPAAHGRIVHLSELWSLAELDLTATDGPAPADQHPAPSSTR